MSTIKNKQRNSFRLFFAIALMLTTLTLFSSCSKDDDEQPTERKSPVILVHGAWQAAYAWEEVKDNLQSQGYEVSVINLKGHGEDETTVSELSLEGYVNQVKEAINAFDQPVILVGHSLGGAIITQAASELPQKIGKLVYVAGFIPQTGKSVLDYAMQDAGSLLGPVLDFNEDGTLAELLDPETNFPNIFIQDGTATQKQFVLDHYKAEAVAPLATPLNYTIQNYQAAGRKYYVFTTLDNAISHPFQQQMASDAGITKSYNIESGHSPFISKANEVTAILNEISND